VARKHGITESTYKNFIIDSGAVYKNYGEASQVLLGATRGGNTFNIATEYREMEVDGARGPVVSSRRITRVDVKLTANFVEIDDAILELALTGATNTNNTTYKTITRAIQIATSDYLTNVAIVGESSGSSSVPVVCILKNPIADGGFEMSFADKDETVVSVEFSGHFSLTDLDTEPYEIRIPVIA